MKNKVILACLLGVVFMHAKQGNFTLSQPHPIVIISIPKSGTHLIAKCVRMLLGDTSDQSQELQGAYNFWNRLNQNTSPTPQQFAAALQRTKQSGETVSYLHLPYNPEFARMLTVHNYKCIYIYRDPRDQLISRTFWVVDRPDKRPELAHKKFDELLLDFIDNNPAYEHPGINDRYRLFLPWSQADCVYAARFEDLIGVQGGGSRQIQLREVKNIAMHIGLELSDQQVEHVADNVFGNSLTFREGVTQKWKKYFKPEHKELFKKCAGDLLIELGYETDLNW